MSAPKSSPRWDWMHVVIRHRWPGKNGKKVAVCAVLFDRADHGGMAKYYTGRRTIAEQAGIGDRTAKLALIDLADVGLIEVIPSRYSTGRNWYRLSIPEAAAEWPVIGSAEAARDAEFCGVTTTPSGVTTTPSGVTTTPSGVTTTPPGVSSTPHRDMKGNEVDRVTQGGADGANSAGAPSPPAPLATRSTAMTMLCGARPPRRLRRRAA